MATTTSPNYTDQDIVDALRIAAQDDSVRIDIEEGERYIAGFEITDLRAFLDALPEPDPQDDWEACEFADIRKGDRVKRVKKNSDGTISTIEGPATFHHLTGWGTYDYYLAFREDDSQDNITLYRIPAPVVHPDPADNQFIIANGKKYVIFGDRYYNIEQVGIYGITGYSPEEFTSWEPADIVAKVIANE